MEGKNLCWSKDSVVSEIPSEYERAKPNFGQVEAPHILYFTTGSMRDILFGSAPVFHANIFTIHVEN